MHLVKILKELEKFPSIIKTLTLPTPSMPGTWEVLWTVLFTILEESHIDPASLIHQHGLSQDNDKKYSKDL
ncbi:hypothetical protein CROQUDRAFT_666858 [Cronartium quercuum f. sp. fusiforme G11]|uniref:Uncharacterized protein n=1 Tax=Cronartium quercuum f. sp. fusiforme G11 TaxID=708437 RepID=A0A9P6N869_9BASI|nr:hypothetical protein CROQUDRAFT_666858 [Cronartium quercuum f. sp. fusiforme G11]